MMQGNIWRIASGVVSYLRKREREVEKVIEVLRPGPLGIVEQKFSEADITTARNAVVRACENWRNAARLK
ncbi:hypothetical protein O6H91_17G043200 [Diphasiastrum complanatum]|uniref:Uncharacterized protein n=2 Tax=Diphasiastrum complanatum TaxID=34168 RepID=A0ACC2B621_DIPCM|nr:hypothetical protein O6H91_17G042600 [Diphasiastrum complanatum]KAJ7525242.1 hypothetical protein O6H91_17G043200 [Diphasiastrum complanatum]